MVELFGCFSHRLKKMSLVVNASQSGNMPKNKKISVENKTLIGFVFTLLMLLLVGGVALINAAKSVDALESVDQTRGVLGELDNFRSKLDRAESMQWAYFLTKEAPYLNDRNSAIAEMNTSFQLLKKLLKESPAQKNRLVRLETAINKRVEIFNESQAIFDAKGFKAAQPIFNTQPEAVATVRSLALEVEREEQMQLSMHKEREYSRLKIISASILLLLVMLALLSGWIKRMVSRFLADEQAFQEVQIPILKMGALQNAIFNSANFSSIATDEKGVIQIFNVGAERMLGYAAADVVDKITPADISDPQEVIARAVALSAELETSITPGFEALVFKASRGIEDIYELTYIRKDGSRFPAIVSVTALRDERENIIGYLLIGTDNTARKLAEEELLKAGALQNAIFDSAYFSSIATDAQGVIQIFNVGAERMLGYSAADVVNKITPAGISDAQEVIARAAALSAELDTPITPGFEALVFKASRGIEDIYELTYIRKDGSRFPAIVSVTALRDAQDKVIGYLLIGTDNTARKQVEEEQALLDQRLRDQQFYTRSLIESNIDALMTTDPRGIISDVNHQMEALTGCTRDELIGAPFKNYFTDPERAQIAITRVLREGKVTNYELTAHARDGKETVVSYNATTFYDRDRNLQGVFAAARDVTERKQFEHALQENNIELENAKAAAEKANLAKSDFLSSMSHELRTPLNAVLGFAQLMASETPPPTLEQKLSIDQILQAGWYLLRLINEILDLAMIESGRVTLSQESMSLTDILQDCQAMIEPQAQKRGLEMIFPSFDEPNYVHADRTRVKQVLINLLSNAIKYNRPGGKVTIECGKSDENHVQITVRDTGIGLSPEQLAHLFQPFNRLGQEASSEEGTGIGLVVTKQLVELMQGKIRVQSEIGVGSAFIVELLAADAPTLDCIEHDENSKLVASPTAAKFMSLQRTVLYVEDNPANLSLVQQLISRRSDLTLITAIDAHLGIAAAHAHQPALILMDINLPGLSGFGALRILRDDPATCHIPIMALSANAVPQEIERGLDAGFFRYLTKPIKVNEFMDALDVALQFANDNGLKRIEKR